MLRPPRRETGRAKGTRSCGARAVAPGAGRHSGHISTGQCPSTRDKGRARLGKRVGRVPGAIIYDGSSRNYSEINDERKGGSWRDA